MAKPITKRKRRVVSTLARRRRTAIASVDAASRRGVMQLSTKAQAQEFATFVTTAGATLMAEALGLPEEVTGADALILFPTDATRTLVLAISAYCNETKLSTEHVVKMLTDQLTLTHGEVAPREVAPERLN